MARLFNIELLSAETFAGGKGNIIYATNADWRQVLLLNFLLPGEAVFFVPSGFADWLKPIMAGRQLVVVPGIYPSLGRKLRGLLREGRSIVIFPGDGQLFDFARVVAGVCRKTGVAANPLAAGMREGTRVLYLGKGVCLNGQAPKPAAHRIYDALRTALFWAKYNEKVNFFDRLLAAVREFGAAKIAAEDFSGPITYRKLLIGCYVLGGKLQRLCRDSERVGTLLPTSIGHVVAFFALCFLGKTPTILNFSSGTATILDCAELADVKCIVTSRLFIEKADLQQLAEKLQDRYTLIYLEDVKETISAKDKIAGVIKYLCGCTAARRDPARLILFTSGSENKPKGVVLKHAHIMANVGQLSGAIDFSSADKMFNALPMFHSFGLTGGVLLPLVSGVETYLYPSPLHYKVIPELIGRKKASIVLGTPTFLMGYAKNAGRDDFSGLRYVVAGGEKLKEEIADYWRAHFDIEIMEAYGTTEASPGLCINSRQFHKRGTVGKFVPALEWRIQEVDGIASGGSLQIKGPNVMEGYILHGKGFVPVDEWYDCGDVVSVDEEGFCTIKARLKRFAKISGEMVSLNQVEEAAERCFLTDMNAAVARADVKKGEKIVLFSAKQDVTRQQLREYLARQQLSMLLMPDELIIVPELPALGNGKTDYLKLQTMVAE